MKPRIGKVDSIFDKTTTEAPAPVMEAVETSAGTSIENKLTVILPPDQGSFLDHLCLDIRAKTKAQIRRTEVIRALIAGVRASGLDLTGCGTEAAIQAAIQEQMKARI